MLAAIRTKLGALPPGCTVAGHRLTLYPDFNLGHTSVSDDGSTFVGIIVGPDTLDNVDISPLSNFFLDWMYWEKFITHKPTSNAFLQEAITRQVKSMRKLEEAGDTCWLAVDGVLGTGPTAGVLSGAHSTLLLMP